MLNSSSSIGVTSLRSFGDSSPRGLAYGSAVPIARPLPLGVDESGGAALEGEPVDVSSPTVDIAPHHAVRRRRLQWPGIGAEFVQATTHHRVDFRFRSPLHLLAAYQQGVRRDGASYVQGLARSTLRDVARKLTFAPEQHEYHEWHDPRIPAGVTYFYFDPAGLQNDREENLADMPLAPRLFFEDATIWSTVAKLRQAIDAPDGANRLYAEALGVVLIHETCTPQQGNSARGKRRQGWLGRMAAADRDRICRGTFVRADTPRHAGASGSIEHLSLLPGIQAIVRRSAAPLPYQPPHREGEGDVGRTETFGDRSRADHRL